MICWQPASSGVSERRAMSSRASSSVALGPIIVAARGGFSPSLVAVQELRIDLEIAQAAATDVEPIVAGLARFHAWRRRILVHQPGQVGRRVGSGKRLFVGDHAIEVEPAERLLEG